jgi:Tfp pilus assembly protein PilV
MGILNQMEATSLYFVNHVPNCWNTNSVITDLARETSSKRDTNLLRRRFLSVRYGE